MAQLFLLRAKVCRIDNQLRWEGRCIALRLPCRVSNLVHCGTMRRRLFTILSALSLLLCVALTIVWGVMGLRLRGGTLIPRVGDPLRWSGQAYFAVQSLNVEITVPSSHPVSPPMAVPYIGPGGEVQKWISTYMMPHEYARWGFVYSIGPATAATTASIQVPDYGPIASHSADIITVPSHAHYLRIPLWFLVMLTATSPVVRFVVRHRRSSPAWRMAHGLCPTCGYDLRASKERCPECGTAILAQNQGVQN